MLNLPLLASQLKGCSLTNLVLQLCTLAAARETHCRQLQKN